MKCKHIICSLIFIVFYIIPSYASEDVTIAVLDLTAKGVPKIVATAISDIIRGEFVNIGNFTVVERSQMKAIIKEQGLQMTGCTDQNCAVKIGKILSARRIVAGEINSLGRKIQITIRYIDVENGVSMFSARESAKSIDDADSAAAKVAKKLAQRIIQEDKDILTFKSPTEYYVRSVVPGLGQFYADRPVKGSLIAGGFLLSGALAYLAYSNFQTADDAYHNEPRGSLQFDSKYNEYESTATMFNYSLVLIGAVYAVHWIDVLFFSNPDFSGSAKSALSDSKDEPFYVHIDAKRGEADLPERRFGVKVGMRF